MSMRPEEQPKDSSNHQKKNIKTVQKGCPMSLMFEAIYNLINPPKTSKFNKKKRRNENKNIS
jgi:hypothetical protein